MVDTGNAQLFTLNKTTTTTLITSAMIHPQHRSQIQEVGSSASLSHSLQPGKRKLSTEHYLATFYCMECGTFQLKIFCHFLSHTFLPFSFLPTWFMLIVQCFTKVSSQTCVNRNILVEETRLKVGNNFLRR